MTKKNNYKYTKDNENRVVEVEGNLYLAEGTRNITNQQKAGNEYRRPDDDGGHLIGNRFDGPSDEENLIAQNRFVNRGAYKSLENEWASELDAGNNVHVKINPQYQEGVERPYAITGEYTVNNGENESVDYFSMTNEDFRIDEFNIDDDKFFFPEEMEYALELTDDNYASLGDNSEEIEHTQDKEQVYSL